MYVSSDNEGKQEVGRYKEEKQMLLLAGRSEADVGYCNAGAAVRFEGPPRVPL